MRARVRRRELEGRARRRLSIVGRGRGSRCRALVSFFFSFFFFFFHLGRGSWNWFSCDSVPRLAGPEPIRLRGRVALWVLLALVLDFLHFRFRLDIRLVGIGGAVRARPARAVRRPPGVCELSILMVQYAFSSAGLDKGLIFFAQGLESRGGPGVAPLFVACGI